MKRQLFTLLLMVLGMTSFAQSGWTDPSSEYQSQTVVYATVDCGGYELYDADVSPEVAAFVDGELRAVVTRFNLVEREDGDLRIYTLRVGGTAEDDGKEITFKLYDPKTGLIYPLQCSETIEWAADATPAQPSSYYTFTVTPVESVQVVYADADAGAVTLNVGETVALDEHVTFNFSTASGATPTIPENEIEWDLSRVDNSRNPTSYYLSIENNMATGLVKSNYPVVAMARFGSLVANVDFFVVQPVTSIEIADADIYLGVGRFVPQPVFNGGESEPNNTAYTLSVETEDVVRVVGLAIIPQALGTAVVTATSDENPEISTTFQVTVISALESMDKGFDADDYEYTRWSDGEEIIDLPNPVFNWLTNEDGSPVIFDTDESYTIASSDPTVIRIDKQETEEGTEILPMSLKKGTAQITYISNYDPSKSVTFTVIVKQSVQRLAITEVNGEEVVEGGMVDVTVGETIVARAEVTPLDADYEEFTMQFVNANWGIIENIGNYVEILSSEVVDGICTFEFKFIEVPETEYFLQAVIDNDYASQIVGINVYNVVESIDVYMNEEYWITEDENIFEFKYNVNPGNVLDPSLTVESSNPDVAEVLMSEDAGMYRIHAYSTGEVTFTFRSVSNPEVSTEVTTVIKREPTGVAIRTIGNIEIPAPGTTPAETVVELALGQNVVAVAGVEPEDATIESFIMDIVDSDDIPFEADVVESGDIIDNGDGTISFSFTFLTVPDRDVYLRAIVNDGLRHKVRLNVKQGVTGIELSETEKTVWFSQDIETFFSITAAVTPDDATNKNLIINLDGDDVISYEGYSEDGEHRFKIQGKGNATITFTSEDNPSVAETCEVTVKKRVSEMYVDSDVFFMLYNDGGDRSSYLRYWPEDADFYSENVTINVYSDMESEDWVPVEIHPLDVVDGALELTVIPRAISYFNVDFIYLNPEEGEEISEPLVYNVEGQVQERMTIGGGWNWLSLINYTEMWFEGIAENLIEARSQSQLVYNDPYWGLFGDLEYMDNTQAYKVNMYQDTETVLEFWSESNGSGRIEPMSLKRGWNWVSYPYEFCYSADDVFNAGNFSENDMILSLNDGFVVNGGNGYWEGTLGDLTPYQGYMIYCNADVELEMPRRFDLPQGYFRGKVIPRAAARERSVWQYDNSRFANVMPIIANVDIENCEEYTIGAFVGDECRGEGKFINGKAFISVGGEVGETVTFRLHNSWTGEFTTITTELAFADKAGSLQAPVLMGTLDGTTGIVDINTIDGNNIESIYDITGRAVTEMSEGIYILKVREGDKVVTKKVRK